MALPAILWDTCPSVGDYDPDGHPRVWGSLDLLYGLLTIESSWRVSINATRASHNSDTFANRSRSGGDLETGLSRGVSWPA